MVVSIVNQLTNQQEMLTGEKLKVPLDVDLNIAIFIRDNM